MARMTERSLTGKFRALDSLLEQDTLPNEWVDQIKKMATHGTVRTGSGSFSAWEPAAKIFLLKESKQLRQFFVKCPFVEHEETRALILDRITTVIERWEQEELKEILAHYKLTIEDEQGNASPSD